MKKPLLLSPTRFAFSPNSPLTFYPASLLNMVELNIYLHDFPFVSIVDPILHKITLPTKKFSVIVDRHIDFCSRSVLVCYAVFLHISSKTAYILLYLTQT